MVDTDGLKELVRKWKVNKEKVPEELQKTKYAKPFRELKDKIKAAGDEIISDTLTRGIVIRNNDEGNALMSEIQKLIEERQADGMGKRFGAALLKHYNVDEFMKLVEGMRISIWNLWIPYWQKHCCLYATPENFEEPYPPPRIYNELTDEFMAEDGRWEKHPEWKSEDRTIITAGACSLLAGALREKENKNDGQTGKH